MKSLHVILLVSVLVVVSINMFLYAIKAGIYGNADAKGMNVVVVNPNGSIENISSTSAQQSTRNISYTCTSDADCSWVITNCCSENSGAYWECVNKNSNVDCQGLTLCVPQVSHQPTTKCSCVNGYCVAPIIIKSG